jgi:hypothetical protein
MKKSFQLIDLYSGWESNEIISQRRTAALGRYKLSNKSASPLIHS